MRKEDIAKFKKSCEVAKSRNDDDKTSFEIRVFGIDDPENIVRIIKGERIGTLVK